MRLGIVFMLLVLTVPVLPAVVSQHSGLEYYLVSVSIPLELLGSDHVLIIPFNVSNPTVLTETNTYVTSEGVPKTSFLFSRIPQIIVLRERFIANNIYQIWYGGGNPYLEYTGVPATERGLELWLAFDDFNNLEDWWLYSATTVLNGRAVVSAGGYVSLNTSYSSRVTSMWLVEASTALQIVFPSSTNYFTAVVITERDFPSIKSLIPDSIYFVDGTGTCIPYTIIYFDKNIGKLGIAVNPMGSQTIYMLYGGVNPCTGLRV